MTTSEMSGIEACTSPQRSQRTSIEPQPVESRSPFKRSQDLLAVLRRKFASKSGKSSDERECRHNAESAAANTVCNSWRSRPRHIDKPIRPAYSDECLSCCAGSRCIRRLGRSEAPPAQDPVALEPVSSAKISGLICQHCRKKSDKSPSEFDSSDFEFSQSEEEKVRSILPVDAEYGHASAPVSSSSQGMTCDAMCAHSLASDSVISDSLPGPSCADHLLSHHQLGCDSHGEVIFETQPVQPAPPFYDRVKEMPKGWSLSQELFRLSKYGWYWGPITRVEAEEKLTNQIDGAFLVRDSSDERYLLSLSFRSYGHTLHTRIEHCNGVFSFYAQHESEGYSSIVDLIEHSMTDSQSGVFCYSRARLPGSLSFPVRLAKPVSRFAQVRSLQYLCRFVIRQYTRVDHIQQLPLPISIKGWLEESQY